MEYLELIRKLKNSSYELVIKADREKELNNETIMELKKMNKYIDRVLREVLEEL